MKTKWSEDWKIYKASSIHKKIKNFYNLQTSKKLCRKDQVTITRIRSEHTRLTHLYLINQNTPPICNICNEQITIIHIIQECPMYNQSRQTILQNFNSDALLYSSSLQEKILNFANQLMSNCKTNCNIVFKHTYCVNYHM